jgi:hypothetical protein
VIKTLNIVLTGTALLALVGVYGLKYSVEETAKALLKADWSYLNQPAHVAPIVARHQEALGLQVIQQAQFVHLDALPMRPAAPDTDALDALFQSLDAGVDPADQTIGE